MVASHQCVPGSIPTLGVIPGLSLLLVCVLAPRGFCPRTPVFPSQKPIFPNSKLIWLSEGHRFVSRNRLLSVTLVIQSPFIIHSFIYLFIYLELSFLLTTTLRRAFVGFTFAICSQSLDFPLLIRRRYVITVPAASLV